MQVRARTWLARLGLLCLGVALGLALLWLLPFAIERAIGLDDPDFRYENALDLFRPDPHAGYANRENFSGTAGGTIPVRTNERGFRGTRPTDARKAPGSLRIVGVGDSVMWGAGVPEGDTLLGQLERRIAETRPVEVINAAVIGYSSLQTVRQVEHALLPLEPDVLLLNFCINDLLPTEDPFQSVRPMHGEYLARLAAVKKPPLAPDLRAEALALREVLRTEKRVWPGIQASSRERMDRMIELLVDHPIRELAQGLRGTNTQLVVLMIPGRVRIAEYRGYARRLEGVVDRAGALSIDLIPDLKPVPRERRAEAPLAALRFTPALRRLFTWRSYQRVQREHLFWDTVHLTSRGSGVAAERVHAFLARSGLL